MQLAYLDKSGWVVAGIPLFFSPEGLGVITADMNNTYCVLRISLNQLIYIRFSVVSSDTRSLCNGRSVTN